VDKLTLVAAGKIPIEECTEKEQWCFRVFNYIHDLILGPPAPATDAEIFKALKVKWPEISRTTVHRYITMCKKTFSFQGIVDKDWERYFFLQQNIRLYNMAMSTNNHMAAERILASRAKYANLDKLDRVKPHPDTYGNHNYYVIFKTNNSESILKLDLNNTHKLSPEALDNVIKEINANSFSEHDQILDEYIKSGTNDK